jgi:hypothetical protein
MSKAVLKTIKESMKEIGINYQFKKWKGHPKYPYFVGSYQEVPTAGEDGMQETSFILTGFTRSTENVDGVLQLEEIKEKIEAYFKTEGGKVVMTDSGSAVAIFYANTFGDLPTGDAELEKIEINLTIKEWSVK